MAPPEGNSARPPDVELLLRPEDNPPLFSNGVTVQINAEEFLITFAFIPPEGDSPSKGQVLGRFVVSPAHAKRILRLLADQVSRHEALFGSMEQEADFNQFLERSH